MLEWMTLDKQFYGFYRELSSEFYHLEKEMVSDGLLDVTLRYQIQQQQTNLQAELRCEMELPSPLGILIRETLSIDMEGNHM